MSSKNKQGRERGWTVFPSRNVRETRSLARRRQAPRRRARARVCVYRGVDARKNSFQIFKGVIHKKVLLYNI